jgi:hypothetical protein
MVIWTHIRHGAVVSQRRKPFDVDFKRAQELIDEKAIADDYIL